MFSKNKNEEQDDLRELFKNNELFGKYYYLFV